MTDSTNTYRPAGTHLLLDFWGAKGLADQNGIDQALREAARACGATLIETKLHQFGNSAGVTGVALLAESHISIHTWPESGYAALDIFVCGHCDPREAIAPLKRHFDPSHFTAAAIDRGNLAQPLHHPLEQGEKAP